VMVLKFDNIVLFVVFSVFLSACTASQLKSKNKTTDCKVVPTRLLVSSGVTFSCSSVKISDINSARLSRYVKMAMKAMITYKISKLPLNCFAFEEDEKIVTGKEFVRVREIHNKQCGGDPRTAPRLLTFEIDIKSLKIKSDQFSTSGKMYKLQKNMSCCRY